MRSSDLRLVAFSAGLLTLSSCAASSLSYVEESRGYSVTRGEMVRVDDLNSPGKEQLSDGVVLKIDEPGCRVTFRIDEAYRVLELPPGGYLVLGEGVDAVLTPLPPASGTEGATASEGLSAVSPSPFTVE